MDALRMLTRSQQLSSSTAEGAPRKPSRIAALVRATQAMGAVTAHYGDAK